MAALATALHLAPPASQARRIPSPRCRVNGTARICGTSMASSTDPLWAVRMMSHRSSIPSRSSKFSLITISPSMAECWAESSTWSPSLARIPITGRADYLRNNVLDARNPFTDFTNNLPSAPATFRQNEFGGAFGGPVRIPHVYNGTNKTYFYVSYEGWRNAKAAGTSYVSPTDAELNGDFTNASVVTSTGAPALLYNPYTTTGTAGNFTRQLLGGDGL